MQTEEFNLDEYKKVMRKEALKEGREEGEKKVNYVLKLVEQGLSYDEIKKKLEKKSKNNLR